MDPASEQDHIYVCSPADGALRQCELVSDVVQIRLALEDVEAAAQANLTIRPLPISMAIVMTQDCDLDQDYVRRKEGRSGNLPCVLLCEVQAAETLRVQAGGSDVWKRIRQNGDPRFHVLQKVPQHEDAIGTGIDHVAIDFKRYFSLPTDELYVRIRKGETKRRCFLGPLYQQHLSSRFAAYLSRVALPHDHVVD